MRRGAQAPRQPSKLSGPAWSIGPRSETWAGPRGFLRFRPAPEPTTGAFYRRPPRLCELENNCRNKPFANCHSALHQLQKLLTILGFLPRMPICCITTSLLPATQNLTHVWLVLHSNTIP